MILLHWNELFFGSSLKPALPLLQMNSLWYLPPHYQHAHHSLQVSYRHQQWCRIQQILISMNLISWEKEMFWIEVSGMVSEHLYESRMTVFVWQRIEINRVISSNIPLILSSTYFLNSKLCTCLVKVWYHDCMDR